MCGILCIVTCEGQSIDCGAVEHTAVDSVPVEAQELTPASFDSTLAHRGPDAVERASVACSGASVELFGSLLQLRGSTTTRALKRSGQCVLCFNGELYRGLPLGEAENDGDALCAALVAAGTDIVATLSRLQGPWAFAFWDGDTLWFGRDVFGRRRHAMMSAFSPCVVDSRLFFTAACSSAGQQPQMRACCLHRQSPWMPTPCQAGMSCRRACTRCHY